MHVCVYIYTQMLGYAHEYIYTYNPVLKYIYTACSKKTLYNQKHLLCKNNLFSIKEILKSKIMFWLTQQEIPSL